MAQTKVQLLQPDLGDVIDFDASTLFVDGADNRIGIRNTNPQYELDVTGTINATNFRGNISVGTIDDWITHTGDTDTKIGFSAADTFEIHAGGGPRLRINSVGQVSIQGTNTSFDTTGDLNSLQLYYEQDSGQASIGPYSSGGSTHLSFYTNDGGSAATEKLRINSTGQIITGGGTAISFNNQGNNAFGSWFEINGSHTVNHCGVLGITGNTVTNNTKVGRIQFLNTDNTHISSAGQNTSRSLASIDVYADVANNNSAEDSGGRLVITTKAKAGNNNELLFLTSDKRVGINVIPTAGDLNTGTTIGHPNFMVDCDHSGNGAYHSARFRCGGDNDWNAAVVTINHSNDRGLAIYGGRSTGNRSWGALQSIDNVGRVTKAIEIIGDEGQGVQDLKFYTGDATTTTERLSITSTGVVSINDSTPETWATLQVNNHSTHNAAQVLIRGADQAQIILRDDTGGSNTKCTTIRNDQGDLIFGQHNDAFSAFTPRLRIKSGGEVRIGDNSTTASTAGDDLVIEGSSDRGLSIISGTSSSANIYFGDSGDADIGRIAYQHNDNALDFQTNAGGTKVRIDSSGRLGIGTTSIDSYLHIKQNATTTYAKIETSHSSSSYTGINLKSATLNFQIWNQGPGNTSGYSGANSVVFWQAAATGPYAFYHGNDERLRIESNGHLGINTTDSDFGQTNAASPFAKGGTKLGVLGSVSIANFSTTTTDYSQLSFYRRHGATAGANGRLQSTHNLGRISWNGASNDTSFPDEVCAIQAVATGGDWWGAAARRATLQFHQYHGEAFRISNSNTQNYSGGSADNRYAQVQVRHKTPYSTDGGYPGSQQSSTNQTVFSLYNESYGGNKMAFRSGQGHQFEIESRTRDLGSGSYNDADVYFRGQYDGSITDRYILGSGGGHTFQNRSKVTFGVGSGGDIWFGENPYNSQWSATNAGGWYYREDQTSMIVASRANTGYATFYINKNTGAGGSQDTRWVDFYWNSNQYGRIEYNGASGTNYVTSSDYRLKENIVSITDGITEVKKLKPYRFNFKTDDDSKVVQGFFAHEAQEIVPYAVSGTKDEVVTQAQVDAGSQPEDKEVGDPIYQNVDYGKFTPILTAALKEAIAKIEVLEAKVAALEGS